MSHTPKPPPKPITDISIRQEIKDYATSTGVSRSELSRRAGVARANISRYFSGKSDLNGESIDRLLHALGGRIVWVDERDSD